ncbi:MAG: CRISPR-associated protein Cas4 [Chloroflexota bacterium]
MGLPGMETGWMALGLTLMLLALALALKARQWWQDSGLPSGDVLFTDMGTWYPQQEALYSRPLQLAGRPDYLIEQPDGMIVPVEIKSSAAPDDPYFGHVMQLAAYCLLVEEAYGVRPSHGIIQYRDRAFSVNFDERIEADFFAVLGAMREDLWAGQVNRDHHNWRRCAGCGHRSHCDQRLA